MENFVKNILSTLGLDSTMNNGSNKEERNSDESKKLLNEDEEAASVKQKRLQKFLALVRKRLKKDGLRLLLLIIVNGFYLYLGGLIFYALEQHPKSESNHKKHVQMLIKAFNENSIGIQEAKKVGFSKYVNNISETSLESIVKEMNKIHSELTESEKPEWTITRAVFFASTVVTTIGYGNLSPVTNAGRWFCVIYAIIGIPLTLIFLALVGKILSKYINNMCAWLINSVRKHFYSDYRYDNNGEFTKITLLTEAENDMIKAKVKIEVVDDLAELQAPAWMAVLLMIIWISLDAILFMALEKWSFTKSLYFIFITLTTIGFGDIVPENDSAVWFNVTLLYVGLAAVSITINLLIANITLQYRKHKNKIQIVKKIDEELEESDEDESNEEDDKTKQQQQHGDDDVDEKPKNLDGL